MAAKMPQKNIDDVEDIMEMIEIFELLRIDRDKKNANLEEMKKKAKEKIEEQSLNRKTVIKRTSNSN